MAAQPKHVVGAHLGLDQLLTGRLLWLALCEAFGGDG
jgi:hypothetical protein